MKHPDILKQLTLEQKVALLSGKDVWSTYTFPQAGVPSMVMSDGPHGLRRQLGRGDHLGQRPSQPATCFPTAACLAGSWDPALLEEVGRALGTEAAAQGVHMLLGPGMNLKRSPLGAGTLSTSPRTPICPASSPPPWCGASSPRGRPPASSTSPPTARSCCA